MDEAGGLIAELQSKLKELDDKVRLYTRDIALEFDRYVESLLQDVPEDVSSSVTEALAEVLKDFPHLESSRQEQIPYSPKAVVETPTAPLAIPQILEMPAEIPRSPHARENEFAGVFTQSFIPLLDSTDRNERRSSSDASPSRPIPLTTVAPRTVRTVDDTGANLSASYSGVTALPPRKIPKRRNTDDAGVTSGQSDGPVRRSAMRRTSSSSKAQSPRRVRFEFAGKEFLTTTAPAPAAPFLIPTDAPHIPLEDSDDEPGALQVEDVDVGPTPPKRISSSQALRALSRGPIEDDGTKWEEVAAPADGSASISIAEAAQDVEDDDDGFLDMSRKRGPAVPSITSITPKPDEPAVSKTEEEVAEEADVLPEMKSRQNSRNQRGFPAKGPSTVENLSPPSTIRPTSQPILPDIPNGASTQYDEDDDLFSFEDGMGVDTSSLLEQPSSGSDTETEVDRESSPQLSKSNITVATYASSPARPIIRPSVQSGETASRRNSYHPFNKPIISDAMHAYAASLGNISSFVGSVNGATGMDEGDVKSFRQSGGGSFSKAFAAVDGEPKSLSERLFLEDVMEEEREKRKARKSR